MHNWRGTDTQNYLLERFETWNMILVLVTNILSCFTRLPDPVACCQNIKQSKSSKSQLNTAQWKSSLHIWRKLIVCVYDEVATWYEIAPVLKSRDAAKSWMWLSYWDLGYHARVQSCVQSLVQQPPLGCSYPPESINNIKRVCLFTIYKNGVIYSTTFLYKVITFITLFFFLFESKYGNGYL